MDISKIVVSYQETANLGNYSNVKPSATIEVTLSEGDDPNVIYGQAMATVRSIVQKQVDDALEAHDHEPLYTTEPRYHLLTRSEGKKDGLPRIAVIAPLEVTHEPHLRQSHSNYRLPKIRQLAQRNYKGALIIDTTIEPDALPLLLEQIAAEDAVIAEEREAERQKRQREQEEWQKKYASQQSDDDDEDDDE